MKFLIVLAVSLAVASAQFGRPPFGRRAFAQPQFAASSVSARAVPRSNTNDQSAQTVRSEADVHPDGSYSYSYETDNGISAQEQGTPRDFGGNPPVRPDVASGSYSYTAPDGTPISVSYIADENGFQPTGSGLHRQERSSAEQKTEVNVKITKRHPTYLQKKCIL